MDGVDASDMFWDYVRRIATTASLSSRSGVFEYAVKRLEATLREMQKGEE